nr:hypothetical protein [Actinomadura spongiicola]
MKLDREWPSVSLMIFMSTPAARLSVAAPCLRSWNRIGGSGPPSSATRTASAGTR